MHVKLECFIRLSSIFPRPLPPPSLRIPFATARSRSLAMFLFAVSLSLSLSVQTYLLTVTLLGAAKNCHCNQMVPYCVTESGHYLLRERLFVKSISHCNQMPLYHVTVTGVSVSECVCISFLLSLFLSFGHCCRPSLSLGRTKERTCHVVVRALRPLRPQSAVSAVSNFNRFPCNLLSR